MIKSLFNKYHYTSRVVLTLMLVVITFVMTGIVEGFVAKKVFPFSGMLLIILMTWFLCRLDGKGLGYLGFVFTRKHVTLLFVGVLFGALLFLLSRLVRCFYANETVGFNEVVDYQALLLGAYYLLPMVVVEEFLYRGYLFKKTIEKSSFLVANIVVATLFMLTHVLDSQVMESVGKVIFFVVAIPVGHLLFAVAFHKSKTILFPIGLHLGNNWATRHLITSGESDTAFLYISNPGQFESWAVFIPFLLLWNGVTLLGIFIIWKWRFAAQANRNEG